MHATFDSLPFQAIHAIFIRYFAIEISEKLNFFPPHAYPPITVCMKFSPSRILIMRNTALDYKLVSSLMISQVPKILKWHAHWIIYFYILSVASRACISYTI